MLRPLDWARNACGDVLNHPVRKVSKNLFAREPISEEDIDALDARGMVEVTDIPGTIDCVASLAAGVFEGSATQLFRTVSTNVMAIHGAGPMRAGLVTAQILNDELNRTQQKAAKFMALTGIAQPPDAERLELEIAGVVKDASSNFERIERGLEVSPFPPLDAFADMTRPLLGLNSGADQITEIRVRTGFREEDFEDREVPDVDLHVFDAAGHQVLWGEMSGPMPGVLYIDRLIATHGRNADDLETDLGGGSVPGRGNALVVAVGLERMVLEGVKNGLYCIATTPATPMVQRLYEQMGFSSPGQGQSYPALWMRWAMQQLPLGAEVEDAVTLLRQQHRGKKVGGAELLIDDLMILDLTRPAAVRQALSAFRWSRHDIHDVPKNVEARLIARGEKITEPSLRAWRKELWAKDEDVRVLRLRDVNGPLPARVIPAQRSGTEPTRREAQAPAPANAPMNALRMNESATSAPATSAPATSAPAMSAPAMKAPRMDAPRPRAAASVPAEDAELPVEALRQRRAAAVLQSWPLGDLTAPDID